MIPLRFPSLQQGENETFPPLFLPCLTEQNSRMGLSGLWKTLNVLDQQWELIQDLKKKNARKIYLKQLQINLRKHHLVYNQGCGEEKNLHKWFHFQMWCINGTKDDSQRNQHHENKSAKTERNVLFLGLEPKIFFSLVTILTSKAEARNVNPYGAPLAADSVSILYTEKGKGSPLCVSAKRKEKEKRKYHLFLNFPRTQITQGGWKHRDEERWFGNSLLELKNQESGRSQEMSEFPVPKRMGFIACVLEKKCFLLPLFVTSSVLLFQQELFFNMVIISISHFLEIHHLLFWASVFSAPPFWLFKLILIKLA